MNARKFVRILVLICLIGAPVWFITDQFIMSAKVAHIWDQFETLVEAKESGAITSYNGKIDSLVNERNKVVNTGEYVFLGKWSTYWVSFGIYFDASWLSKDAMQLLARIANHGVNNIFDYPIIGFILLFKPLIYTFLCFVFYWLRKPTTKS